MQELQKSICVFCGSNHGKKKEYKETTKKLGKHIVKNGFRLVYGGGNQGIMGLLANSVKENNGEILGVIPKILFKEKEISIDNKNHFIVDDMHSRKMKMFNESDIFVVLPGGIGTLDEFFEILTWAQLKIHNKKIILLNCKNFWTPIISLLHHLIENKFLKKEIFELFTIVNEVEEIFNHIYEKNPKSPNNK
tara:strand:+ start:60 stop:635 length:576 start_codon:yes stop_codon:yes gene_type:complete